MIELAGAVERGSAPIPARQRACQPVFTHTHRVSHDASSRLTNAAARAALQATASAGSSSTVARSTNSTPAQPTALPATAKALMACLLHPATS